MHTPTFCPKRKILAGIHVNNVAIIIYSLTALNYSYFIIKKTGPLYEPVISRLFNHITLNGFCYHDHFLWSQIRRC